MGTCATIRETSRAHVLQPHYPRRQPIQVRLQRAPREYRAPFLPSWVPSLRMNTSGFFACLIFSPSTPQSEIGLGCGGAVDPPGGVVTARSVHRRIATSPYHTCVIMGAEVTGPVKCWGMNWNGQLGYGDTVSRGGSSSDMGGNLGFVDLGTGRTAKSLAAAAAGGLGSGFSCALLDNDKVRP
jgi:hypothetical protein